VASIKKSWSTARKLAKELAARKGDHIDLSDVTPHTLKHTAITWALQKGSSTWDVAGYFSTSIDTIERVYGHHSPDHQKTAVEAMNRSR
jgi:integrase